MNNLYTQTFNNVDEYFFDWDINSLLVLRQNFQSPIKIKINFSNLSQFLVLYYYGDIFQTVRHENFHNETKFSYRIYRFQFYFRFTNYVGNKANYVIELYAKDIRINQSLNIRIPLNIAGNSLYIIPFTTQSNLYKNFPAHQHQIFTQNSLYKIFLELPILISSFQSISICKLYLNYFPFHVLMIRSIWRTLHHFEMFRSGNTSYDFQ